MKDDSIILAHGEGGLATKRLIEEIFEPLIGNDTLSRCEDAAIFATTAKKIAFTTDAFIVEPIFFPGGSIGKLAISGSVNDLAAMAAKPLYLSASFIIEEGLAIADLKEIVCDFAKELSSSGTSLIAADTKVVPRGQGGKIFISTAAIGQVIYDVGTEMVSPGDEIVISGDIARHAAAIISAREQIETNPQICSDCASLWHIVETAIDSGIEIHAMRDPTRGGLATILNEIAGKVCIQIVAEEMEIPIQKQVETICDIYGYDPLYMANEGKMVFFVTRGDGEKLVSVLRSIPTCENAAIIGSVHKGSGVLMNTRTGGTRKLITLEGKQLPRIC